jgi:hypothetical protein
MALRIARLAVLLGLFSGYAWSATLQEDTERYIATFNGPVDLHSNAADTLPWMGLSDPGLFDILERRILEEKDGASGFGRRDDRNRVARYVRGLGFSGQPKYAQTLRQLVGEREFDRFAKAALEDLPHYEKWNPIISDRATFDPKYSDDVNRVRNMLLTDDLLLARLAAKRVFLASREDELVDRLADALKKNYQRDGDAEAVNSLGWLIKGVSSAKLPRHLPLLQEVARNAPNRSVQRHADDAARSYSR